MIWRWACEMQLEMQYVRFHNICVTVRSLTFSVLVLRKLMQESRLLLAEQSQTIFVQCLNFDFLIRHYFYYFPYRNNFILIFLYLYFIRSFLLWRFLENCLECPNIIPLRFFIVSYSSFSFFLYVQLIPFVLF